VAVGVAVLVGADVQSVVSSNSAEGLFYVIPFALGGFAVAAYSSRRAALFGLALLVPAYVLYAVEDRGVSGGDSGSEWAASFFGLVLLVAWLVGAFVRSRREASTLEVQAARLEREAQLAAVQERARIARELHDVIAHGVSVMGLQAGAAERVLEIDPERAREPLQAIQSGAREAVFELRRLLGILREGEEPAALAPVPRLAQLASLVERVALYGGALTTGRTDAGGFRVLAGLPYEGVS
jgi:signal transduction histidine kinase